MKAPAIGELRHRVLLKKPEHMADDGGGRKLSWADADTVWAKVETGKGIETYHANQLQPSYDTIVTIRGRQDVEPGWLIIHQGREFKVITKTNLEDRTKIWLVLYCLEEHPE